MNDGIDMFMAKLGAVVGLGLGVLFVLLGAPLWVLPAMVVGNIVLAVTA